MTCAYYATLAILNFICSKYNGVRKYSRFLKSVFYCYDSASIFSFSLANRVFRRFLKFFFLYGVITDVSCLSIFIRFFDL